MEEREGWLSGRNILFFLIGVTMLAFVGDLVVYAKDARNKATVNVTPAVHNAARPAYDPGDIPNPAGVK